VLTPPEPATRLRHAREARGLSSRQVAEATKLSVRLVEALEAGHLSLLPEGIYRRAIVRAVAREVGLVPDAILADYARACPDELPEPRLPRAIEAPRVSHSTSRLAAVVGAVVPILAGAGYLLWPTSGVVSRSERAAPVGVRHTAVEPAGGLGMEPAHTEGAVTVTLSISARCHVLAMADGREVLNRRLEPGDTVAIELREELALSGDDASAVQFSINGQAGRPFGEADEPLSAHIRRDDYAALLVRD